MMKTYNNPERDSWSEMLKRPTNTYADLEELVNEIFDEIDRDGDLAIRKYSERFDKVCIQNFEVEPSELKQAQNLISEDLKSAIKLAKDNIEYFHNTQKIREDKIETIAGVECWQESRGIEKVGIYIPGGTAPLFSTVLMLAVPAKIAKCEEIVLCTPPDKKGNIHPAILYTAMICGVNRIFKVGGIQAIGALTYGTKSIPKVFKIFGPGNQFVTIAKQIALNKGVAIDMPAGPSELLVVADHSCEPAFVAADLLSQAEHGADSQVVCIVNKMELIPLIKDEIKCQLNMLSRKYITREALNSSLFICLNTKEAIIDLVNEYAPEHLILATEKNAFYQQNLKSTGSVFIGNYTPESAGDYVSGTNHTLPTDGFAKMYSGVNLDSFCKKITFQEINKKGLKEIGRAIEIMAQAEGLQAHKNAISIRLKVLGNE